MKKQDNLLNLKYKFQFDMTSLQSVPTMKASMVLLDHHMQFKLLDSSASLAKSRDILKSILRPTFYSEPEESFYINYSLLKTVHIDSTNNLTNRLVIELFNPLNPNNVTLTLFKIELAGLVFNKSVQGEALNTLINFLQVKVRSETKFLIEQFLKFFNVLREGAFNNSLSKSSDERVVKCYLMSKKYYDNNIIELKKHDKLKISIKKKIFAKQSHPDQGVSNNRKSNSNSNSTSNKEETELNEIIETALPDNTYNPYCTFEYLASEIKAKSLNMIEDSTYLFFQIASLEMNLINLKKINKVKVSDQLKFLNENDMRKGAKTSCGNNFNRSFDYTYTDNSRNTVVDPIMNRSANFDASSPSITEKFYKLPNTNNNNAKFEDTSKHLRTNSTKTNSYKESNEFTSNKSKDPDTPKFCGRNSYNFNKDSSKREHREILTYTQIVKKIEANKQTHAFLPTNSYLNVFQNCIEIIHRKFFELCIEEFFNKIFSIEKDSNGIIKLESLYNCFLYLRGFKNLLFTEKNKLFFSNVFFYED